MWDLPDAVSVEMLQEAADKDKDYASLGKSVKEGKKPKEGELTPYMSVWTELGVVDNFSLDSLTPRQSHLRRGDHIYPMVLQLLAPGTNLPGQAQGMPWARCDRPGVNVITPAYM